MENADTTPADANKWWNETDFVQMERITGFHQMDFDSEDGYQDFIDACDTYWNQLDDSEKIRICKEFIDC